MTVLKLIRNKTEEVARWVNDDPLNYYIHGLPSMKVDFKELLFLESIIEFDDTEFTASPNYTLDMLENIIATHKQEDKYEFTFED